MDEEYVQEHILTGVLSGQLEAPRRLIHGRYSHFARRCRVYRHICGVLRACVVRAADSCALSWLHRHRKPPPCSMGAVRDCAGGQILVTRRYDGTSCKLMATLGVVVNSLGNLEAVSPAASVLPSDTSTMA